MNTSSQGRAGSRDPSFPGVGGKLCVQLSEMISFKLASIYDWALESEDALEGGGLLSAMRVARESGCGSRSVWMSYTDPQTAMAEMRPWVGESLSAALFEVQQDVPVVLCQSQNEDPLGRVSLDNKEACARNGGELRLERHQDRVRSPRKSG